MKARGRVDRVPAMDSLDYPLVSTAGSWVALLGGRGRFHQPYLSARGVLPTNPGDDRRRRLDWASDNNEEGWFRGGPDLRLGRILARTLDSFPDRIGLAIRRSPRGTARPSRRVPGGPIRRLGTGNRRRTCGVRRGSVAREMGLGSKGKGAGPRDQAWLGNEGSHNGIRTRGRPRPRTDADGGASGYLYPNA